VRAWWGAPLVLGVVSCTARTTPFAGVEVALGVDSTLAGTPITELAVTIGSVDGGATYKSQTFLIDDSGVPGSAQLPASFAIASNGNPNATVAFDLAVSNGPRLLDDERYLLVHVPSTRVAQMLVLFAASCPARPGATAVVACPLGNACTWQGTYWLCDASSLPGPEADAGWPSLGVADAAPANDAKDAASAYAANDAAPAKDATLANDVNDAAPPIDSMLASDAGDDADTDDADTDDAGVGCVEVVDFDDDAAITIPCEAGCDPGEQCVEGQCLPVPPSCAQSTPGAGYDCGFAGNDDCCASDEVAAGTFYRSDDGVKSSDTSWPASVSQYRLDRYEVTIGRFREFVNATTSLPGQWVPDAGSGKHTHVHCGNGLSSGGDGGVTYEPGWQPSWNQFLPSSKSGWDIALTADCDAGLDELPNDPRDWTPDVGSPDAGASERRPINCVTWYEAYAFCIWDGGFLPSNNEWAYAAAGGSEQRAFSWGSGGPYDNATYAVYSCYYPPTPSGQYVCEGVENIADVGFARLGVGRWGQLDLTGSMFEPVLDIAADFPLPCVDCAVTTNGTVRLSYGGSWFSVSSQLWNVEPSTLNPNDAVFVTGVRCARTPYP
jgi:sulfatase modifying factor 1